MMMKADLTHNRQDQGKRITLIDVARDAGVSRATASLVLRGSPLVAGHTRDKVIASMQKLGYVYNRAAASLRTRRSRTIGLIITDISNPFFAQMTVGSEALLEGGDYAMLLGNTSDKLDKQERLLEAMQEYGIDGLLLCPARGTPPETIERLRRWRLPFVLITRYLLNTHADYVGADNVLGAELAIEHLVAHGHRRIAFLGGPPDSSARQDRQRGYGNVLRRHGLAVDGTLTITSSITRDGGYRAIRKLLHLAHPPTAVLCYNDIIAFGAMLGLQAAGLEPGPDVAVIGFDNIEESSLWHPPLTTVSIEPHQIGTEAANLLLERVANPEEAPRQVILIPSLVIRDSCGSHTETKSRENKFDLQQPSDTNKPAPQELEHISIKR